MPQNPLNSNSRRGQSVEVSGHHQSPEWTTMSNPPAKVLANGVCCCVKKGNRPLLVRVQVTRLVSREPRRQPGPHSGLVQPRGASGVSLQRLQHSDWFEDSIDPCLWRRCCCLKQVRCQGCWLHPFQISRRHCIDERIEVGIMQTKLCQYVTASRLTGSELLCFLPDY